VSDTEASGAGGYLRLVRYLRPYRWTFSASLLCMVLAALFDAFSLVLLIPFLRSLFGQGALLPGGGRNAAERVIHWVVGGWLQGATGLEALRAICLVVLAAILLKNLFLYGARFLGIVVQERIERDMRDQVYAHLQRLPLPFFSGTRAGQLIARVLTDTRETKRIVSYALADALRQVVTAIAYLLTMLALSWRLTLVAAVLAPVLAGALRPLLRRLRRGFRKAYDEQGDLLSILAETVSGVRLVKAYGAEEYERDRFRRRSGRFTRRLVRTEAVSQLASPMSEVLSALVALALLWIGANMVLGAGSMGPEQFLTFITIALRLISPVKALAQLPAKAQSSMAAADRFFEVLDTTPEPAVLPVPDAGEAGAPGHPSGLERELRFEGVWFEYEPDRPVLRDISFVAPRGRVLALVGPSGAGKSTLVDLLPRFIVPTGGRITLDGVDLRRIDLASLRALMGIVSQETVIFNDTVRANIAYGAGDGWGQEALREAARAANALEFVEELPQGWDTLLGDRGVRLSGGQRQRIGIARAILRDPPILILDEATSNLDAESERLIQAAMDRLLSGRTVFVIAHRLSTVRGADRILVLDEGRLVESGAHGELYAAGGLYRRLVEMQLEPGGAGREAEEAPPDGSGVA
jgi:subfamily B ATP-binding cassette protein MsbA